MSDALKKLEEIEARRDVLSKLTFDNEHSGCPGDDPHGVMKIGGVRVAWIDDYGFDDAHQEAIEQAGGDLALLARLLRSVAEEECGLFHGSHLKKFIQGDGRVRCPEIAKIREDSANTQFVWCIPCRTRRELAAGGAR